MRDRLERERERLNYLLVPVELYIEDGASGGAMERSAAVVVEAAGVVFAQNFRSSLCRRDRYIRILRARQIVLEWATKGGWLSRIERYCGRCLERKIPKKKRKKKKKKNEKKKNAHISLSSHSFVVFFSSRAISSLSPSSGASSFRDEDTELIHLPFPTSLLKEEAEI